VLQDLATADHHHLAGDKDGDVVINAGERFLAAVALITVESHTCAISACVVSVQSQILCVIGIWQLRSGDCLKGSDACMVRCRKRSASEWRLRTPIT
jgi:hypothetical protein